MHSFPHFGQLTEEVHWCRYCHIQSHSSVIYNWHIQQTTLICWSWWLPALINPNNSASSLSVTPNEFHPPLQQQHLTHRRHSPDLNSYFNLSVEIWLLHKLQMANHPSINLQFQHFLDALFPILGMQMWNIQTSPISVLAQCKYWQKKSYLLAFLELSDLSRTTPYTPSLTTVTPLLTKSNGVCARGPYKLKFCETTLKMFTAQAR